MLSEASDQILDCCKSPNKHYLIILFGEYLLHTMYSFIFCLSPGDCFGWFCLQNHPGSRKDVFLRDCKHDHIRALLCPFSSFFFDRSIFIASLRFTRVSYKTLWHEQSGFVPDCQKCGNNKIIAVDCHAKKCHR